MSINVNGTDYETQVGELDLKVVFNHNAIESGLVTQDIFESNVVAFHTSEGFRNFVTKAYSNEKAEKNPQLLLVSMGGPDSIGSLIREARAAGIKSARAGTARRQRAWQTNLIEALVGVGHKAMSDYYDANKQDLWSKCSVPTDAQSDNYADMLINSGRGTLGYKVERWDGVSPKTGDEGTFAITLTYRLDANNKGRAKRKGPSNGVSDSAHAAAPAK